MAYFVLLLIPFVLYAVGTIWMTRRFYRQAEATGVDPGKTLSAAGFGLTALIVGFLLFGYLLGTSNTEHVLSVASSVLVGLTTQWTISKWMIPDPPSKPAPPSDIADSP